MLGKVLLLAGTEELAIASWVDCGASSLAV